MWKEFFFVLACRFLCLDRVFCEVNRIFFSLTYLAILQDIKRESWVLTDEGKLYAAAGSPEMQLFLAIPPEGISPDELQVGSF